MTWRDYWLPIAAVILFMHYCLPRDTVVLIAWVCGAVVVWNMLYGAMKELFRRN